MGVDIETYSSVDLVKTGTRPYTEAPDFAILLISYKVDDQPTRIIDLTGGAGATITLLPVETADLPAGDLDEFLCLLSDPGVIKTAYNAAFERTCLARYFDRPMPPEQWQCTMVQAATMGLPGTLAQVGAALGLEKQKMEEGKELIRYFCKPTKDGTRRLPGDAPEKWERFKQYNVRDVDVETDIRERLSRWPRPQVELDAWALDQRINDRGVRLDAALVDQALKLDAEYSSRLMGEARELTGLQNPNSDAQLKTWLGAHGVLADSLDKESIPALLDAAPDDTTRRALQLRQELGKTSVKKYEAIDRAMCSDGRVHGLLQFYGANRTGRWAGRLVQVQNLPQNHIPDLALARDLVKTGRYDDLETLFESTPNVLSELIRTAFIPRPGTRFIVADFSAIEARVIAWLSGEQWRLDVFQQGGDIYCASASQMFGVPVEKHGQNSHLRQKGKIAELALGYGGSVGALTAMGALEMGLTEEELPELVKQWRAANPHITKLWWNVDAAATEALEEKTETAVGMIRFVYQSKKLFVVLPSGRKLCYMRPDFTTNRFGNRSMCYMGVGENKKWTSIETYGPKLVENIVQAIARDLLALAMLRLRNAGYEIVMHIHDEAVLEVPIGESSVEEICAIMGEAPDWAAGLPLRADGYECDFYKKD